MQKRNTRDSANRAQDLSEADAYTTDEVPNEGGKALKPDRNPADRDTRKHDRTIE